MRLEDRKRNGSVTVLAQPPQGPIIEIHGSGQRGNLQTGSPFPPDEEPLSRRRRARSRWANGLILSLILEHAGESSAKPRSTGWRSGLRHPRTPNLVPSWRRGAITEPLITRYKRCLRKLDFDELVTDSGCDGNYFEDV